MTGLFCGMQFLIPITVHLFLLISFLCVKCLLAPGGFVSSKFKPSGLNAGSDQMLQEKSENCNHPVASPFFLSLDL